MRLYHFTSALFLPMIRGNGLACRHIINNFATQLGFPRQYPEANQADPFDVINHTHIWLTSVPEPEGHGLHGERDMTPNEIALYKRTRPDAKGPFRTMDKLAARVCVEVPDDEQGKTWDTWLSLAQQFVSQDVIERLRVGAIIGTYMALVTPQQLAQHRNDPNARDHTWYLYRGQILPERVVSLEAFDAATGTYKPWVG